MKVFDGKPPSSEANKPFFSHGKRGGFQHLDWGYQTRKCRDKNYGFKNRKPSHFPKRLDGTSDPPDKAIDYPTLREWYAQCTATLSPCMETRRTLAVTQTYLKVWQWGGDYDSLRMFGRGSGNPRFWFFGFIKITPRVGGKNQITVRWRGWLTN